MKLGNKYLINNDSITGFFSVTTVYFIGTDFSHFKDSNVDYS